MNDLIGRALGPYRIVEQIGAGWMGEVYRSHDERLDRNLGIHQVSQSEHSGSKKTVSDSRSSPAEAPG